MMAERGFDRSNIFVGHANPVSQRSDDPFSAFQYGESRRAEPFIVALQLLEHIQPRTFLRLLPQHPIKDLSGLVEFVLNLSQAQLPLFNRSPAALHREL